MKILRYVLYGLAVAALLAAGVFAYFAATFDTRDYHARIVQLVGEKTGRTLAIQGDVALSFWPDIGVRLGALTLSERGSTERFASIESARLRLKMRPLLARELIADELTITGAHVQIVRYEDGRLNIDDLLKGEGGAPSVDIGRFALERSAVTFRDAASARRYELTQIDVVTGRLVNNVPTPLKVVFNARDAEPTFQLGVALNARLTFDLEHQRYALGEAGVEANGQVPGLKDLVVKGRGNVSVDVRAKELRATELSIALGGTAHEEKIEVRADAPQIVMANETSVEGLAATLAAQGSAGVTTVKLAAPRFTFEGDTIGSQSVALDIEVKRAQHVIRAAIATPLESSVRNRTVLLKDLNADFVASGPRLPGKTLSGAARGSASVDVAKEGVQLTLAGKVAGSGVKLQVAAAGFAAPVYTFAVNIDELDLDRYTSASSSPRASPAATLDLSPLAELPASGTLHIGVLKSGNVKARNVRLEIK